MLVHNIPELMDLDEDLTRDFWTRFRQTKRKKNCTIIEFGEFNEKAFFVERGKVGIYVVQTQTTEHMK